MSSRPLATVLGAGGLFGSNVARHLAGSGDYFPVGEPLVWHDLTRLSAQFASVVSRLTTAAREQHRPWVIFWCAGVGHVSSPVAVHQHDQAVLQCLLAAIAGDDSGDGVLVFASSAGAIYAGNRDWPANEATSPNAIHAYGESKLLQEQVIQEAVDASGNISAVNLRISNLYGVGQSIDKRQGLLSHLVAHTVRGEPSKIYVPLDTSRDYLFVGDAAKMAVRAGHVFAGRGAGSCAVQLLAKEENFTVAQILGILGRIMKRRIPVLARSTEFTDLQPRLLSFRSHDFDQRSLAKVSIEEGLSRLLAAHSLTG